MKVIFFFSSNKDKEEFNRAGGRSKNPGGWGQVLM
jgi:hypothetical protein